MQDNVKNTGTRPAGLRLSDQDMERRELILTGSLWKALFTVGIPLAFYQSLTLVFRLFDTAMASHISAESVSAVAYLSQINVALSSLGLGLAVGGSIKLSEAYGVGDFELVHRRVSSLFALCGVLGLGGLLLIPVTPMLLRLARTPEEFIALGTPYFNVGLVDMAVLFLDNAYIAVERARGNGGRILRLNFAALSIKLVVTAVLVYGLNGTITHIAVATLVSDLLILAAGCYYMLQGKEQVFGFDIKAVSWKGKVAGPMVSLSIPVAGEKLAFSLGKVIVNSMSTVYGALVVGALSVSNNLGGITTNPQDGFQQGGAAVISQNVGAGNYKRAISAFYRLMVIDVAESLLISGITLLCIHPLTLLLSSGDASFAQSIAHLYRYEAIGSWGLGICSASMAFLYGFGYTKLTLLINFVRLFGMRIPLLWYMQHFTTRGSESLGVVMLSSNLMAGGLALVIAIAVIRHIRATHPEADRHSRS